MTPDHAAAAAGDGQPAPLLVFPCNGNAIEACDGLGAAGAPYRLIAFVDDSPAKRSRSVFGRPVLDRSALLRWPEVRVLAVPGSPQSFRVRRAVIEGLDVPSDRYATVVHPAASVSPHAHIGHNVLVMAGAVVCAGASIGDHVCLLPNTVVHHDSVVGAWSLVGANVTLAGGVVLGENCYVASGSSVRDGVHIGAGALVGMGSVVLRDVAAGSTVAGCPARVIAPGHA